MFKNEPLSDFSNPDVVQAYACALAAHAAQAAVGNLYACPIVGGVEKMTRTTIESMDPSAALSLGKVHLGSLEDADEALASVKSGRSAWEQAAVPVRTAILRKIAAILRKRRMSLSALITLEEGKPWAEADADTAEAIDFCEYYALEMERLGAPVKTQEVQDEDNFYFYQPRGIAAVISPWNFPLAITCGMTVAALVTGNTVILKPARQASLIAYELSKIILEAGVPSDAFAFLPSPGGKVGAYLAAHPDIDMICFTGSREVGLDLIETAGTVKAGQRNVKRVIAEMGGKNAIIVDDGADMSSAVQGVLVSAFGYAGQKCSACSRLIVVGEKYEEFMRHLADAASKIPVGLASDPATFVGPVIDEASRERIAEIIAQGETRLQIAFKGKAPNRGYFVPPTIFRDVPPDDGIWREEIFGPVLAACRAQSFEEALEKANDSSYALTGGVFSEDREHLELAKREFRVGNLYLNRKITGAFVCRQPFGGFKMSGIGSKAGGQDYLLQFLEPRTVTENLRVR